VFQTVVGIAVSFTCEGVDIEDDIGMALLCHRSIVILESKPVAPHESHVEAPAKATVDVVRDDPIGDPLAQHASSREHTSAEPDVDVDAEQAKEGLPERLEMRIRCVQHVPPAKRTDSRQLNDFKASVQTVITASDDDEAAAVRIMSMLCKCGAPSLAMTVIAVAEENDREVPCFEQACKTVFRTCPPSLTLQALEVSSGDLKDANKLWDYLPKPPCVNPAKTQLQIEERAVLFHKGKFGDDGGIYWFDEPIHRHPEQPELARRELVERVRCVSKRGNACALQVSWLRAAPSSHRRMWACHCSLCVSCTSRATPRVKACAAVTRKDRNTVSKWAC